MQSTAAAGASAQAASEPATTAHNPITPLTWLQGIPPEMSLVMYIDQTTVQIMEIVAVERKAVTNLFGVPLYMGKHTEWQALGKFSLRRKNSDTATAFQAQEDALNHLESLLSTRWHNSTNLAMLDQSILRAFEAACMPDGAPVFELPTAPDAISQLRQLLQSRSIMSEEATRIDESLICAFQQIGVALPGQAPPAG